MPLATLVQGSVGLDVKNLQRALNYHLSEERPPLAVDGIFGPKTRTWLITFQSRYGLKVDAIVGPKTREALYTFAVLNHVLALRTYPYQTTPPFQKTAVTSIGAASPLPPAPILPPLRMPTYPALRVPQPTNWTFPLFGPIPHFRLDPQFYLWLRTQPFEVEAGAEIAFKKTTEKEGPSSAAFFEATARIWVSPPLLGGHVTVASKLAFGGEKRTRFTKHGADSQMEGHLAILIGVEVANLVPLGPLDIFHLEVEAAIEKSTDQKPVDYKVEFEAGPTVEVAIGKWKFTFGAASYLELQTNGDQHDMAWGVRGKGVARF